jgi:hypothetical protein
MLQAMPRFVHGFVSMAKKKKTTPPFIFI